MRASHHTEGALAEVERANSNKLRLPGVSEVLDMFVTEPAKAGKSQQKPVLV
jgi:hypothetical protein